MSGATISSALTLRPQSISIHAPMSGATPSYALTPSISTYFNPRSHVGSDQKLLKLSLHDLKFQSTLPCRERRFTIYVYIGEFSISIHAPMSGATVDRQIRGLIETISIHAPMSGATSQCYCIPFTSTNFNPRSHVGSD